MLVITRKTDESFVIGDDVIVTVVRVRGTIVRIGIEAPRAKTVLRCELFDANLAAVRRTIANADDPTLGTDYA